MKILFYLFVSINIMLSAAISPQQMQLLKASGYTENDVKKALESRTETQKELRKEQKTVNNIKKERNLFHNDSLINSYKTKLTRYGTMFFNNKNKLNPYSVPTPLNYSMNHGDKILLNIYGANNQEFKLIIDNNGKVNIPQVGNISIIGLSFDNAQDIIKEETKKAFPNSTNILVNMFEYSSIQITVAGFVNAPGLYNLSSFSTIKDALIASGGILKNGSYRNIYLKRDGKLKKVFDLYKLIRFGDNSSDEMLQNGDVILVKPVDKEIVLTGEVNYSAIYELKTGESYRDLLDIAAGFKATANKNAILLKRYEHKPKVYTLDSSKLFNTKPKNGDKIHVYALSEINANLVTITGNIVAPGSREIPKDKKLSTLINIEMKRFGKKSYFKNNTNYDYAVVKNDTTQKSFNLKKLFTKSVDIDLVPGDEIIIYRNDEFQEKPYIYASGDIVDSANQKYGFFDGMKTKDLFDLVKFKSDIIENEKRVAVFVDRTKLQITRIENNLKRTFLVSDNELENTNLNPFDIVTFFEYSKVNNLNKTTIKGEVFIPGTYEIPNKITINNLVKLAGGFTKKALMSRFEIVKYSVKNDERVRTIESLNLKDALAKNIIINPDDELTIFPIAKWNEKKYIELTGLVRFPGKYPIVEGEKLSNVIIRAGGFLKESFIEGAVFTREDVKLLQQKRMDESIERLKSKAFQSNLIASKAGEDINEKQNMLNALKLVEKEASLNKSIGRISMKLFFDMKRFINSKYDITLKSGDKLFIPSINDTVSVVGEVLNQNTFIYDNKLDVEDYVNKAGGLNSSADLDYIYVVKANGESEKYEKNFFWLNTMSVFKGDTIIVPLKIDTVSDIAFAKDVTSILYQLAITAASLKTVGSI